MSDLSSFLSTRNKEWSANLWDGFIEAVQARLAPLEEQLDIQKEVADAIIARGLTVIEQELAPIVAQADQILDESTAEITAKLDRFEHKVTGGTVICASNTSATLTSAATLNLTVIPADREFFAPTPFLALSRASTTANWAIAKVNSFNRSTGVLAITLEQVTGAGGPYTDWIITSLPGATMLQKSYYEQTLALRQQVAGDKEATAADRQAAVAANNAAQTAAGQSIAAKGASQQAYADMRKAIAEPLIPPTDPVVGQIWWDGSITRIYDGVGYVPTVTTSIGGRRFERGTFGPSPDGVITVGGGFTAALVFVNGSLLREGDDYRATSPEIVILSPQEGDEWFVEAYLATDATDYDTKEQVDAKIADAIAPLATKADSVRVGGPQDLSPAQKGQARANIDTGLLSGFRNKIINGNILIYQRGTIFIVPASQSLFVADRWIIYNNSNQPVTIECPSTIHFGGSGLYGRIRIFFASTAPTSGDISVVQRIERADTLANRRVTMSFAYSSSDVGLSARCYMSQNFGAGGSNTIYTPNAYAPLQNDGGIGIAKILFDLPSTEGKVFGPNHFLEYAIALPIRTNKVVTLTDMSLVEGDATSEDNPFSPRHIQQELALCQRYYEVLRSIFFGAAWNEGELQRATWPFKTVKRVIPTIVKGQSVWVSQYSSVDALLVDGAAGVVIIEGAVADAEL
ncbi:hypothetical protein [Brucella sp. 2280]|uniref:hypothetical protein n=1 Tax=Brucella sp. 2280 TaxID=2592625 RepID=UPI001297A193|nr:hypothetical protein [Brucella sp. 2280]QGA57781.1 hypothetical protein GHC20_11700 [Brucella sp. 2280]